MLYNSIVDAIGHTPMVRLERYCKDLKGTIFLKLEYLNPGGSHKARIAHNMVRVALEDKHLKSGDTILEATGGNTGKGIAMAAIVAGCKVVLVIPDNYSDRKVNILKAMGVTVKRSESAKGLRANGELAMSLQFDNPDWFQPLQMNNPANPQAHRQSTGPEIVRDMSPRPVDYFVAGFGTGGHLTGVGETLKAAHKSVKVICVQPEECDLESDLYCPHQFQGLAVGRTPQNLNKGLIDSFAKVSYEESIEAIRRLLTTEAIGIGPSSGAILAAATEIARERAGANIVCLAYDSLEDYPEVIDKIISLGPETHQSEYCSTNS